MPELPEILYDGRTVWVNGPDGCCLGRFSYAWIDVHKDYIGQQSGGQCLDCKKGPTNLEDWRAFQASMLAHYGVKISNNSAPKFITAALKIKP